MQIRSIRCVMMPAAVAAALLLGCSEQKPPAPQSPAGISATEPPGDHHDDQHRDGEHRHEHGAGPHGGTLADWGGGKYHVEFTVDHDRRQATVYILGSDEKTPAPIAAADDQLLLTITQPFFSVDLQAAPQAGDPPGTASRFVGTHEQLGVVQEFAGTIAGEVEGVPYAGDFQEQAHEQEQPRS